MSANQRSSHVDRALPTIRKRKRTDAEKVALTRTTSDSVKATPEWATATDLQAVVNAWNGKADAIDAQAQLLAALHEQTRVASSHLAILRRDWQALTGQVLSTVSVHSKGSVNKVKAFGFDVITRANRAVIEAPGGLVVTRGKAPGEIVASWARGIAPNG
jgi:hypothetical protein